MERRFTVAHTNKPVEKDHHFHPREARLRVTSCDHSPRVVDFALQGSRTVCPPEFSIATVIPLITNILYYFSFMSQPPGNHLFN